MTERGTSGGMEITSTALLAAAAYFDGRAAHLSNHATGYTRGDIERLHIGLMVDLSQACKHAAQAANATGQGRREATYPARDCSTGGQHGND